MEETRFLLHELRLQNALELDEKKNLDTKASNITSYSVTFTVLFFGVGTFVMEKMQTSNSVLLILFALLLAGIILAVLCVTISVIAFRLREYQFVMTHGNFFSINELPPDKQKWHSFFNEKEIENWIYDFKNEVDYEDFMIKEHLIMLNRNSTVNDLKAKWIRWAHLFFVLAVCMIPTMLVIILVGVAIEIIVIG